MLEVVYFIDHSEVSDEGSVDVKCKIICVLYEGRECPSVVDSYAVVFDFFVLAVYEKDT
jgi:hypothetical protein